MAAKNSAYMPIDPEQCRILAGVLGDAPETVISVHLLQRGLCYAYVAGEPKDFQVAVVQGAFDPAEPMIFGEDTELIWELLQAVPGWDCINVKTEIAAAMGEIIERETGRKVRYYGDVYHVLSRPATRFANDAVRRLLIDDWKLLERAPAELRGAGFESKQAMLTEGVVAGAIVDDELVAIAHTSARTEHYADIGVYTSMEWRGKGFSSAAASIVAQKLQEDGQTPTWSTGEDNWASLRVAQKLGYEEVSQRTYVIPGAIG